MKAARPVRLDVLILGNGELRASIDLQSLDGIACRFGDFGEFGGKIAASPAADVVVADLSTSACREAALGWLRQGRPQSPLLGVVTPSVPDAALRELTSWVDDLIFAPVRAPELEARLRRLVGTATDAPRAAARRLARELGLRNLVGNAPEFRRLLDGIPRLAASDANVLITGETGTGKECFARAIHHSGPRQERPFIAIDCGACPDQLLENELFGHARGAFTDAREDHRGLVAVADRGVLFLDEIDALSMTAQSKLLRFLQERTYKPLGGVRVVQADVRIIAATNQDLWTLVKERRFRADLYYRLNVLPLHILPLRERRSDIRLLAYHFLDQETPAGARRRSFTESALRALGEYGFPGNVRELGNMIQRATVVVEADTIDEGDLLFVDGGPPQRPAAGQGSFRQAKARVIADFERSLISELLAKHHGNVTLASREAQQDRRVFGRLVKKYNLGRDR